MIQNSNDQATELPFWEKPLEELTQREWEALCDGCGLCCLKTLSDYDTGQIHYTRVICRVYNIDRCKCSHYESRKSLVSECVVIREQDISELTWIPSSCAYRLRHEGKPLFDWHPLRTGSRAAMDAAGISVKGKVLAEDYVHEDGLEEHIITWVKAGDQ